MENEKEDLEKIEDLSIDKEELEAELKELEQEADEEGFEETEQSEEIEQAIENTNFDFFSNTNTTQTNPFLEASPIENLEEDLQNTPEIQQTQTQQTQETGAQVYNMPNYSASEEYYKDIGERELNQNSGMTITPSLIKREDEIALTNQQQRLNFQPWQEAFDQPSHKRERKIEDYVGKVQREDKESLPFEQRKKRRF